MRFKHIIPIASLLLFAGTARAQIPGEGPPPTTPGGGGATPPPSTSPTPPAPTRPAAPAADPATPPTTEKSTAKGGSTRKKGLHIIGTLGIDGCTPAGCVYVYPLLGLRIQALYRIMKYVAAGLHMGFNFAHPDTDRYEEMYPGFKNKAMWAFNIAVEGRAIYPADKFDFYASMLMGYGRYMFDLKTDFGKIENWMNAFTFGGGFGADYFFSKNMAAGANFYVFTPTASKQCSESSSGKNCNKLERSEKRHLGIWWMLGFSFTYFLNL